MSGDTHLPCPHIGLLILCCPAHKPQPEAFCSPAHLFGFLWTLVFPIHLLTFVNFAWSALSVHMWALFLKSIDRLSFDYCCHCFSVPATKLANWTPHPEIWNLFLMVCIPADLLTVRSCHVNLSKDFLWLVCFSVLYMLPHAHQHDKKDFLHKYQENILHYNTYCNLFVVSASNANTWLRRQWRWKVLNNFVITRMVWIL